MAIDALPITDEQLGAVLSYKEGHFLELKAKEIQPSKLTRTVSAFANADGGELYVGIAEGSQLAGCPHRWDGFPNYEAANAHLQVLDQLFPLGQDFQYCFLTHSNSPGCVLQLVVKKTRAIQKANNGIPYVRRGAQNLPADTPEKLRILELNKGITSYETESVPVDLANVCNSQTVIKFILEIVPSAEPEAWLRKQELIKNDKPTVAGVALFSDLPQAVLPKRTGVKIYRYRTSESMGSRETLAGDPETIEGCAYDLIAETVRRTQDIINEIQILGAHGFERATYPIEALHEVITNAVLHRDYALADEVHVRIFDNRVEVQSPGRLPAHITPANILQERFARNGSLVRVINKFRNPPNKDIGEGLNTAFQAMRNMRLKDPIVEETENAVIVHIRHERLASADALVMEYLESNEMITNRVARGLTGVRSENSMKNVFLRLRDAGLIRPVPGRSGFASAWEKSNSSQKENSIEG